VIRSAEMINLMTRFKLSRFKTDFHFAEITRVNLILESKRVIRYAIAIMIFKLIWYRPLTHCRVATRCHVTPVAVAARSVRITPVAVA